VGPRLFYCDHHPIPLPPGHKFPIEKYSRLRALLAADGVYDLQPAPPADAATIELAHDRAYVRAILDGSAGHRVMRRIGFPWSPELVRRTLASVGGTLAASRDAMARGFGGNLAGGTHHAFRGEGSGFCVFNDLAVAILALRRDGLAARAAVIDLDVHQGDRTAAIFEGRPRRTDALNARPRTTSRSAKTRSRIDIALARTERAMRIPAAVAGRVTRSGGLPPGRDLLPIGRRRSGEATFGTVGAHPGRLRERDRLVLAHARFRW
jgi:hypothetical protein